MGIQTIKIWVLEVIIVILFAGLLSILVMSDNPDEFIITAYCDRGLTKTGMQAQDGICAVDPKVIKLHSLVRIEGLGLFVAEDTGRLIKGKRADIWIGDCQKAKEFGKQRRKVWLE